MIKGRKITSCRQVEQWHDTMYNCMLPLMLQAHVATKTRLFSRASHRHKISTIIKNNPTLAPPSLNTTHSCCPHTRPNILIPHINRRHNDHLQGTHLSPHPVHSHHQKYSPTTLQDIITDDEIISDSYPIKEIDGVAYEADCKKINIGGESFDVGGNPSAEGGEEEGVDDSAQTVIDVVHSFRLQETSFDKKSYLSHLKGT
jgi:hypothetical protein